MTDYQDLIDRLAAAALDAREAVREAHGATKDLRHAQADVERLVGRLVDDQWDEKVEKVILEELSSLQVLLQKAQDSKTKQIMDAFKVLTDHMLYGRKGGPRRGIFICPEGHPLEPEFRALEARMYAPVES